MVPEKDILLLPGRVFAFVLKTRTFGKLPQPDSGNGWFIRSSHCILQVPLWLSGLQPIQAKTEGLQNLQLADNTFKDTLQALVKMHFVQKLTQKSPNFENEIAQGKGKYQLFSRASTVNSKQNS